jgi:hypothetical protein
MILYPLLAIGLGLLVYAVYLSLQEWADEHRNRAAEYKRYSEYLKTEYDHMRKQYLEHMEKVEQEKDALRRSAMCRELAWIEERKLLNARNNFMATELTNDDPNKLTTLFQR